MSILILDRDSKMILAATLRQPMTIKQLADNLAIPIAICSKKVLQMKVHGLLSRNVIVDENGNEIVYYKGIPPEERTPADIKILLKKPVAT